MSANHIIYYTWATSEVSADRSSEGRRGSLGGFFEKLRRSSVLNANVGAVFRCTCVGLGVPWALLGSTWTRCMGHLMAQAFVFLRVFVVPGVFLKAFLNPLGQAIGQQRGHWWCNFCSHEFRLRECADRKVRGCSEHSTLFLRRKLLETLNPNFWKHGWNPNSSKP